MFANLYFTSRRTKAGITTSCAETSLIYQSMHCKNLYSMVESHKKHLMMSKIKELPQDLHSLAVAKQTDSSVYGRISELLNVPVSTVGVIIQKWKEHNLTINWPWSGAPRKV